LIRRSKQGNQVLYQANRNCPVFEELAGLGFMLELSIECGTARRKPRDSCKSTHVF
jgi:hypothetical protein